MAVPGFETFRSQLMGFDPAGHLEGYLCHVEVPGRSLRVRTNSCGSTRCGEFDMQHTNLIMCCTQLLLQTTDFLAGGVLHGGESLLQFQVLVADLKCL